jgi:hypothetical protein
MIAAMTRDSRFHQHYSRVIEMRQKIVLHALGSPEQIHMAENIADFFDLLIPRLDAEPRPFNALGTRMMAGREIAFGILDGKEALFPVACITPTQETRSAYVDAKYADPASHELPGGEGMDLEGDGKTPEKDGSLEPKSPQSAESSEDAPGAGSGRGAGKAKVVSLQSTPSSPRRRVQPRKRENTEQEPSEHTRKAMNINGKPTVPPVEGGFVLVNQAEGQSNSRSPPSAPPTRNAEDGDGPPLFSHGAANEVNEPTLSKMLGIDVAPTPPTQPSGDQTLTPPASQSKAETPPPGVHAGLAREPPAAATLAQAGVTGSTATPAAAPPADQPLDCESYFAKYDDEAWKTKAAKAAAEEALEKEAENF